MPLLQESDTAGSEWSEWCALAHDLARRLATDAARAPDIAQEALTVLVMKRDQVQNPTAWLLTVVKRMAIKSERRARLEAERCQPLTDEVSARSDDAGIRTADLRRALRDTSRRQASLLRLYARGHSHREIAAILGCCVHQVGPRLQRALRALSRRLSWKPRGFVLRQDSTRCRTHPAAAPAARRARVGTG